MPLRTAWLPCLWFRTRMASLKKAVFGFATLFYELRPFFTANGTRLSWPALVWFYFAIFLDCTLVWIKKASCFYKPWVSWAKLHCGKSNPQGALLPATRSVVMTTTLRMEEQAQVALYEVSDQVPLLRTWLAAVSSPIRAMHYSLTFTVALLTFEWEKH